MIVRMTDCQDKGQLLPGEMRKLSDSVRSVFRSASRVDFPDWLGAEQQHVASVPQGTFLHRSKMRHILQFGKETSGSAPTPQGRYQIGHLIPDARSSPCFSQLARNSPAITKAGPAIERIQISFTAGGTGRDVDTTHVT